jgi:hypothetical protein
MANDIRDAVDTQHHDEFSLIDAKEEVIEGGH